MAKSTVAITKGTDAEKMVAEALSLLGGVENLIRPDSTVVVKPNGIGNLPWERGTSTTPAVLTAVLKTLRKAKPKQIIVAEAVRPNGFEINSLRKAAEEGGADRIINIRDEKDLIKIAIRSHRSYMTSVELPRFLVEADHVVNVPIFKSHVSMDFTCALKNMKGIVQFPIQAEMHVKGRLADSMMDLWQACRADLQIVDLTRPTEGYGPLSGTPVNGYNIIVAGKDPVPVDATCCRIVGIDMDKVPYWDVAKERGLGPYEEKDIEIKGKKIKDVHKPIWIPYLGDVSKEFPEYQIYVNQACTMCTGLIAYSMERIKALKEYDKNKGMVIVTGKVDKLPPEAKGKRKDQIIIFGDCARALKDEGIFVEGCPPGENEPAASVMDKVYSGFGPGKRDYFGEIATFLEFLKDKKAAKK